MQRSGFNQADRPGQRRRAIAGMATWISGPIGRKALSKGVRGMHVPLFDGSNAGLELDGGRAFSVQYHPEASPGPQDSMYLFERFVGMGASEAADA